MIWFPVLFLFLEAGRRWNKNNVYVWTELLNMYSLTGMDIDMVLNTYKT